MNLSKHMGKILFTLFLFAIFSVSNLNAQDIPDKLDPPIQIEHSGESVYQDIPVESSEPLSTEEMTAMLNSAPADIQMLSDEELVSLYQNDLAFDQGAPGGSYGEIPIADTQSLARSLYADEWAALEEALIAENADSPYSSIENLDDPSGMASPLAVEDVNAFSRYLVNGPDVSGVNYLQSIYPHSAIGRLYFKKHGTTRWSWCSAAVVGDQTIVTAGHCVYSRSSDPALRGWNYSYRFFPGVRQRTDGRLVTPFGYFTAYRQRTMTAWINSGDFSNDVATLKLNNKNGFTLKQWVGKFGVMWNAGVNRHVHAFGYPANLWNGRFLIATADQVFYNGSHTVGIGSDMQHGASGGPWVFRYQPLYAFTNTNMVYSVNSFGNPSVNGIYGPYFDSNNIAILCSIDGC